MEIEKEIEQLKKRVEFLESLLLQKQAKSKNKEDGRDKTRYMFENKIYPKNRFVLAVVNKYVHDNSPTLSQLHEVFDKSLQGSLNVVETIDNAQNIKDCGKRYFMQNPLSLCDGNIVVVCTQWGIFNIVKFEKVVEKLGYSFDRV